MPVRAALICMRRHDTGAGTEGKGNLQANEEPPRMGRLERLDGWRVTGTRVVSRSQVCDGEDDPVSACAVSIPSRMDACDRSIDLEGSASGEPENRALPRKEVIQPHLPVRLPCYDFVPITNPTFDGCLLAVGPPASGVIGFHDVTGGVYKAREHIHRSMLTCGY